MDALAREVAEESAVTIKVLRLAGVYTDPGHVMAYPGGEIRQRFALCFHAIAVSGDAHPDHDEMTQAAWIDVDELDRLPIHASVRLRLDHALHKPDRVQVL